MPYRQAFPRANEPGWYRCACGEWLHGPPALYSWCPIQGSVVRPMVDVGDGERGS